EASALQERGGRRCCQPSALETLRNLLDETGEELADEHRRPGDAGPAGSLGWGIDCELQFFGALASAAVRLHHPIEPHRLPERFVVLNDLARVGIAARLPSHIGVK